jgi:hypothetical protein
MARLYFFSFLLATFSLAFSQEKIKSLGKAEFLVVTKDDNSVLMNEKTIAIYNAGYEEIYRKELPKNTIKLLSYNYYFQDDVLFLETKATAGESVTSIFIKFDLKNQDYSIIKEQSYIRSVKDVAYSPDYYYKYIIDGKAVSIYTTDNSVGKPIYQGELTTRIETVDLDPFQSDQLLIGDKMTLRLVNMQNNRFLPIDISSFEKAMVIKPYTFLILSRGDLLFYNTQNFRENRTLISGIEDFKLNSDRTSIYLKLDNGDVEVWKLDASKFSAPMLTAAVLSDNIQEVINQLNQEETEIYQANKEKIDRELEIKSAYFNPKRK